MPTESAFALLGFGVVAALLLYALSPLRRGDRRPRPEQAIVAQAAEGRLLDEREAVLRALAELDFDRQLGNLDDADYLDLRDRYRHRAVAVLRALDGHEPALDEQIEQAVALHRAARREESGRMMLAQRAAVQPRLPRRVGGRDLPAAPPAPDARRGRTWLAFALGAAFLFAGGVLTLYLALSRGHSAQAPLATLTVPGPRAVASAPGPTLLLAAADGLHHSTDLGRTWALVPGVSGVPLALLSSGAADQPPLLATAEGIYRAADAARWERRADAPSGQLVALARGGQPATLYAAAADGHLFSSGDEGHTWQPLPPAPAPVTALATVPGTPDLLLVGTDGQGVLASADGGATWGPANGFAGGLLDSTHVRGLAFDPTSGDSATTPGGRSFSGTLYAATDQGLSRSLDGGSSWSRLPFRGDIRVLGLGPGTPAPLYLLDAQGRLYRSADRGVSW